MRIGKLVFRMRWKQADLKARGKQATFGNYVAGAAELAAATGRPPTREIAFIIPLGTATEATRASGYIDQILVERFGVVVCLKADVQQSDKYGFLVYDKVHTVRSEVMNAFLGWQLSEGESVIQYRGESLIEFSPSYLWYQYEFEYKARLASTAIDDGIVEGDVEEKGWQDVEPETPANLNQIYSQYILQPDFEERLPLDPTQDIPLPDGFPDVTLPNITQNIEREE